MQTRHRFALAALFVTSLLATYAYAQATAPQRVRWEYRILEWKQMREQGLAQLGNEGWELVAVQTDIRKLDFEVNGSRDVVTESWYYFKRPR